MTRLCLALSLYLNISNFSDYCRHERLGWDGLGFCLIVPSNVRGWRREVTPTCQSVGVSAYTLQ